MRNKKNKGFTLIELLVVVAIIGLLSSVALIALISARQKSRNTKRLGDMTQMNTALELYFTANRGYPTGTNGVPQDLQPKYVTTIPTAPMPPDGPCEFLTHSSPVPSGVSANTYYYVPSGSSQIIDGKEVFPDYSYFFCLGHKTGDFNPGVRTVTPSGVK